MWWEQAIQRFEAQNLRRRLFPGSPAGPYLVKDGRRLLNLASNDYLGLSTDRRLLEAAREALEDWGIGAGAARLIVGDRPVHAQLEETLAAAKGTEAALVFCSGYAACVGVLSALAAPGDQVFLDALCHASLYDGARLSHARLRRYRHRDPVHLEELLIGNSSAATIPLALALESHRFQTGDVVLLTAVGAGLLTAAAVIRW